MTPETNFKRAVWNAAAPRPMWVWMLVLLLAGCAAQREHRGGLDLLAQGKTAEGLEGLRRASTLEPENAGYRIDYLNERDKALATYLAQAETERLAGRFDQAVQRYRDAARIDAGNERVRAGLLSTDAERRALGTLQAAERQQQAGQTESALEQVRRVLKELPRHARALDLQRSLEARLESERQAREEQLAARAAFKRPVTLQFRDAPLKMVFEAISRAGNVNLVIDRDVKSDVRTTIFVRDASIEDALDVILLQNQLERRVLNSNSLLIYPATAAKQKELAELKVRSFQISNIDVGFMATILKTMLKTRDIVTDAKTSTLVMRDTAEAVALAERLIAANDVPDPEVMLEVEVLEVSTTRASEIGLRLPSAVTLSLPGASGGALNLADFGNVHKSQVGVSPLSATLNMMLQDGDANILASPRIRSRSKEKARILVGDKLPIITNLISPQQAGQSTVVTGSVQYVEVGIKLDVEPQVYADGDVGIRLTLEVSNVTDTVETQSGRAYQIGTRSAQTTLRLRDGETQVMAGLINDSDRSSSSKVPGLGQMPLLGRLFSSNTDNTKKSEIVLSITPRIIRPVANVDARLAEAWSGTETGVRDRALRIEPLSTLRAVAPAGPGAAPAPAAPAVVAPPSPAAAPATSPSTAPSTAPAGAPAAAPAAAPAGNVGPSGALAGQPIALPRTVPGARPLQPAAPAAPAAEGKESEPPAEAKP